MSDTRLNATPDEARLVARLVNAWSAAQTVIEQLTPVMNDLGLIKASGGLDTDRVLLVMSAARQQPEKSSDAGTPKEE